MHKNIEELLIKIRVETNDLSKWQNEQNDRATNIMAMSVLFLIHCTIVIMDCVMDFVCLWTVVGRLPPTPQRY